MKKDFVVWWDDGQGAVFQEIVETLEEAKDLRAALYRDLPGLESVDFANLDVYIQPVSHSQTLVIRNGQIDLDPFQLVDFGCMDCGSVFTGYFDVAGGDTELPCPHCGVCNATWEPFTLEVVGSGVDYRIPGLRVVLPHCVVVFP